LFGGVIVDVRNTRIWCYNPSGKAFWW
jgi:hypothetical protein